MLFEIEEIVVAVMGPQTDNNQYNKEFIIDVLMEYINNGSSEQYIDFALKRLRHAQRKVPELIKRAKHLREMKSKSNRIMTHDVITDENIIFDGIVSGVGGYVLFITPHNKLYDILRKDPKRLIGRIFLETLSNGVELQYLKVVSCTPTWITSKSKRQLLKNLEYHAVKFNRIHHPLVAAEKIQDYRDKYGE